MSAQAKIPPISTPFGADPLSDAVSLSQRELDERVKTYRGTVNDVIVTPDLAQYILATYNTGNRTLRSQHVLDFVLVLRREAWINTGEAIIFAREGILNNGQHRLQGVAQSGIPAVMDLRFGIPRAAFAVTDTGAKRQAGDILSILHIAQPFAVAAALRMLIAYQRGLPTFYGSAYQTGNDEIVAAFDRWPGIVGAVDLALRTLPKRGFVNAATNAFSYLAINETDRETVRAFLSLVANGRSRSASDPPRLLRARLLEDQAVLGSTRAGAIERFALFIKAWTQWRAGGKLHTLSYQPDEPFPTMAFTL